MYLDIFREDWDNFQIKKMNKELKNEVFVRKISKGREYPVLLASSSPLTRLRRVTHSLSSPWRVDVLAEASCPIPKVVLCVWYYWLNSCKDNDYDLLCYFTGTVELRIPFVDGCLCVCIYIYIYMSCTCWISSQRLKYHWLDGWECKSYLYICIVE